MAELKNTFSWSFSAADDFEECRRRRYWGKYAMWGGWQRDADPVQRTAYRLSKMENQFSLKGNAVENSVVWILRQKQRGVDVTANEAYETVARPFLNNAWVESRKRMWESNPKKFCCLAEHYYNKLDADSQKALTSRIIDDTRKCISNFIEYVLPRIAGVTPQDEVPIATVATGDPENFLFEGIKVYAIPDYAYTLDKTMHIHDWKSGARKERHREQLAMYALWACIKHGMSPENITLSIEYLLSGEKEDVPCSPDKIESVKSRIRQSATDMSDYLVDNDRSRNEPLPRDEWEMVANLRVCGMCNYFELCRPELKDILGT